MCAHFLGRKHTKTTLGHNEVHGPQISNFKESTLLCCIGNKSNSFPSEVTWQHHHSSSLCPRIVRCPCMHGCVKSRGLTSTGGAINWCHGIWLWDLVPLLYCWFCVTFHVLPAKFNSIRRGNQSLVPWVLIVRSSPPSVLLVLCYFSHFGSKNSIQFNGK